MIWRFFTGSVRRQLITGVALVHAVMMSLFIGDLVVRQQSMLLAQQITQTRALAQSTATSTAGWLLARDVTGLQEIIDAQQRYPELIFAMAVDREGLILAHTDASKRGLFLTDLPADAKLTVMSETAALTDVMTPVTVAEQQVGWIRIGIGQKESQAQLAVIVRDGFIYALAAILIGVILAGYMGSRLTRRLYAIQKVADAIKRQEWQVRAEVGGSDEAARLADEFNSMLDALEHTTADLSATLQAIPDLLFELDQDGYYLNIWAHDPELLMAQRNALLGHSVEEMLPAEAASVVMEALKLAAEEGYSHGQTFCLPLAQGEHWFELSTSLKSTSGSESRFIMLSRDITEQHRLRLEHERDQQKVLESEASLNRAQHIAHIGSWEFDLETNKLSWSDEVYQIFGLDSKAFEASYEGFLQAIHPDDREMVNEAYTRSLKTREPYDIVHRLQMSDGTVKYVRENGETRYDSEGNPQHSSGTIQDITEQKIKDEQLHRSQKMDAMGKLTGGIAHDFNNMLGVILGYSELLQLQLADNPKQARYITEIQHAGERAQKLTSRLLAFSRKEAISVESVDINKLLHDNRHMLEKSLTARIQLKLELDEEIWPICLEPGHLEDAILNMSINAMHAMPDGGSLTVSTKNIHLEAVDTYGLNIPSGDYVQLSMTDTGTGMDRETRERVFDPFFSTKGEQGTGLGMSQVYGFVQQSKGAVRLYSELGHGTRIVIYFPRSVDSPVEGEVADMEQSKEAPSGSETILVVDDELGLRELFSEILSSHGYRVLMADSAKAALQLLQKERVDLMLSDVIMPEMDGYQLAEQVEKSYPWMKIQMISGFDDAGDARAGKSELRKGRLNKPVSSELLLKRIHELLELSNGQEAPERGYEKVSTELLMPIEWSAQFSSGIKVIDADHKALVTLLNRCVALVQSDGKHRDILSLLDELLDYTDYHFRREEIIMGICDYPLRQRHSQNHRLLLDELNRNVREFGSGRQDIRKLLAFLLNWLSTHIQGTDKEIVAYSVGKEEKIREAFAS